MVTPDSAADRLAALGGADVILELIGAPNLDFDFSALALKGRIIIVGTTAGQEGGISLRTLMGKRASLRGTMLRARPLEEKAAAVHSTGRWCRCWPRAGRSRHRPGVPRGRGHRGVRLPDQAGEGGEGPA